MTKPYRPIPATEVLGRLPAERRKKIDARAAELIAEERAPQELRAAKQLTRSFKDTVIARALRDAAFRDALLTEGVDALRSGNIETGKDSG